MGRLCSQDTAHQPEADLDALDAVSDAAAVAVRCALPSHYERHARRAVPLAQRPQPDGERVVRQVVQPLLAARPAGQLIPPAMASQRARVSVDVWLRFTVGSSTRSNLHP